MGQIGVLPPAERVSSLLAKANLGALHTGRVLGDLHTGRVRKTFFFLTAFSILVVLFSVSFFNRPEADQVERTIAELRSRPEHLELLRGPRGYRGEIGPRGKQGIVDSSEVVDALVNDARLTTLVRKAVEEIALDVGEKGTSKPIEE